SPCTAPQATATPQAAGPSSATSPSWTAQSRSGHESSSTATSTPSATGSAGAATSTSTAATPGASNGRSTSAGDTCVWWWSDDDDPTRPHGPRRVSPVGATSSRPLLPRDLLLRNLRPLPAGTNKPAKARTGTAGDTPARQR